MAANHRDCLTIDDVLSHVAGGPDARDAAAVELHLDACASCRALVARVADSDDAPPGPDTLLAAGDRLGRYEIIEPMGAGGMGIVYAARDDMLGRRVALKTLRPCGTDVDGVVRLEREARLLAKLSHPNVVGVYDVVQDRGRVAIAMELVEGARLDVWVATAAPGRDAIVSAFAAVGEGLAAAHAAGIVHRDVKPSNILVGFDGRARIGDFGIAQTGRDRAAGSVAGTPAFMAPEQRLGADASAASDQYSFCLALYWSLFRSWPADLAREDLAFPRRPRITRRVRATIARGLRRDPEQRWPTMTDLVERLRRPRSATRRTIAWAGAMTLLAGGGFVAGTRSAPRYARWCDDPHATESRWTDEHRRAVRSAPAADPEGAEALVTALDGYSVALAEAFGEACAASGRAADLRRDLPRFACLEERAHLLTRIVAALAAGVGHAAPSSLALLDPAECVEPDEWLQRQPLPAIATDEELGAIASARADMKSARLAWGWGDLQGAEATLDALDASPTLTWFPPLATERLWTSVVLRSVLEGVSETEVVDARYRVVASATQSGHSWVAAIAWIELAEWAGPAQAMAYTEIAAAHVSALQHPDAALSIRLAMVEARAHRLRGDLATAARVLERARDATDDRFWRAAFGDDLAEVQRASDDVAVAVTTGAAALSDAAQVEGQPPLWHVMLAARQAMRLVAAGECSSARALVHARAVWADAQSLDAFGAGYVQLQLALVELACEGGDAVRVAASRARDAFAQAGIARGATTLCDALVLASGDARDRDGRIARVVADLRAVPRDDVLDAADRFNAWAAVVLVQSTEDAHASGHVRALLDAAAEIPAWELPASIRDPWLRRQRAALPAVLTPIEHAELERALDR